MRTLRDPNMWWQTFRAVPVLALGFLFPVSAGEETETFVFECDGEKTYTVQTIGNQAWVFRRGGSLRLPAVPYDNGRRFTDGSFEVRIEGQHAWIGQAAGVPLRCRNDRRRAIWEHAKLDGVDFRGVGNEPGWHLEIRERRRAVLIADYGELTVEATLPEPSVNTQTLTTHWDAGELTIEVSSRTCRDTMSGEQFPAQVVVNWRGRTFRGCGRTLH